MDKSNIVSLFFSHRPSMNYILSDGCVAHFVDGRYFTANEKHIAELNEVVASDNPFIFTKQEQLTISRDQLDPMVALKSRMREELLAEIAAGRDFGNAPKPESGAGNSVSSTGGVIVAGVKVGPISK